MLGLLEILRVVLGLDPLDLGPDLHLGVLRSAGQLRPKAAAWTLR